MQRSYQCCDAMGELVQAGTVKWDAATHEWHIYVPEGKPPVTLKCCPHCGETIFSMEAHIEECDLFGEVAEELELYESGLSGPQAKPSSGWADCDVEITHCPKCGDELESGDPIKQQAD